MVISFGEYSFVLCISHEICKVEVLCHEQRNVGCAVFLDVSLPIDEFALSLRSSPTRNIEEKVQRGPISSKTVGLVVKTLGSGPACRI